MKSVEYGVGRYDADWNRIEAEWYMKGVNVQKRENVGMPGFSVVCDTKATLTYPKVRNLTDKSVIEFVGICNGSGTVELHQGSEDGPLLGSICMRGKAKPYAWNRRIKNVMQLGDALPDEADLCIVLKPDADSSISIDYFHFY